MSKESQARINRYAHLIEDGKWQQSIREMVADNMSYKDIREFCENIGFYPDREFKELAINLTESSKNKEALYGFFGKVKVKV